MITKDAEVQFEPETKDAEVQFEPETKDVEVQCDHSEEVGIIIAYCSKYFVCF